MENAPGVPERQFLYISSLNLSEKSMENTSRDSWVISFVLLYKLPLQVNSERMLLQVPEPNPSSPPINLY